MGRAFTATPAGSAGNLGVAAALDRFGQRLAWVEVDILLHVPFVGAKPVMATSTVSCDGVLTFIGFANTHGTALLHTEAWLSYTGGEQTLALLEFFLCMADVVFGIPDSHMSFATVAYILGIFRFL